MSIDLIKYTTHKKNNQEERPYMIDKLSGIGLQRHDDCGTTLIFIADKLCENKKLARGNFCNNRFCSTCAWRQTKKDTLKIDTLMKYINTEYEKEFIFLTLTTPNIPAEQLKQEIDLYNIAFQRLLKRQEIEKVVKGYIRKLEVTYNQERNDFHLHFHCLIAVNKSYFSDKTYIKHDIWLKFWQEVTGRPEITQVDVRRVKQNESKSEVFEIATYSAKPSQYIGHGKEIFDIFYNALYRRQLLVYGGLFAKASKLHKEKKLEHFKDYDPNSYYWFLRYSWTGGDYRENEKRELTDFEKGKYNGRKIDEYDRTDDEYFNAYKL